MPNHVKNTLSFSGDPKRISEMKEKIKNDEYGLGTIDFEKIIPMPENIYRGDLGPAEMKKYGENNWYNFRTSHWGTKWNAYGFEDYIIAYRFEDLIPLFDSINKIEKHLDQITAVARKTKNVNIDAITKARIEIEQMRHDVITFLVTLKETRSCNNKEPQ